ncbi:unnamed protein product [Adineta ricciae]|uniref:Nicotianamine synthase n=3 Tax=Adineta ricciae TaxID=249248 RepID=A0A815SUM4_ADIRI|nr:unnamed protein product [Adineta ricciae]
MSTSTKWREIYNRIMSLPSLTPSDQVNEAIDSLREQISQSNEDDLNKSGLTEQEIIQLRQRFSQSVYELEKSWAHKILNHSNHQLTLEQFPQWDNYLKVMKREWDSIQIYAKEFLTKKVLLIGGGPIPLSAIILAQQYHISSVVMDIDEEATDLARKIVFALGLQNQITLIQSSGESFQNYQEYSLIYVAALAGLVLEGKQKIFDTIKSQTTPGTFILTRSSHGTRQILYLPLHQRIQEQFETVMEIHPNDEVMNSIILLKTI